MTLRIPLAFRAGLAMPVLPYVFAACGIATAMPGSGESTTRATAIPPSHEQDSYPRPTQKPLDTRVNYVPNSSFEERDEKGAPLRWRSDDPGVSSDPFAFSGKYSVRIHSDPKAIRHISCSVTNGQELLGKTVELSCVSFVPRAAEKPSPFVLSLFYMLDGQEKYFETIVGSVNRWNIVRVTGAVPANADPDSIRVLISVRPSVVDFALVDDVSLVIK
ncbi:MAG: hypothetical protein HZB26_19010 [Candidatus Hydrogenedentes bacterium]|nr:hypothetical protein [Candidatus Hydrogenedentota bacterium]